MPPCVVSQWSYDLLGLMTPPESRLASRLYFRLAVKAKKKKKHEHAFTL